MLDILTHVFKFMDCDKNKCLLAMTCSRLMKSDFYFDNLIDIEKITHSQRFDKFTNIHLETNIQKLPLSVTRINLGEHFEFNKYYIPPTVKIITIYWNGFVFSNLLFNFYFRIQNFGESIADYFPISVTEICFVGPFDAIQQQNIENVLKRNDLMITFMNPKN